jgi:hypothetical protein
MVQGYFIFALDLVLSNIMHYVMLQAGIAESQHGSPLPLGFRTRLPPANILPAIPPSNERSPIDFGSASCNAVIFGTIAVI